jgi:Tfp pilus assembly protein PilO
MNLLIPIILIAISVGAFFAFIDPEYKKVQALGNIDKEFRSKIKQGEEIREKKRVITKEYEDNVSKDDLDRLKKMLPDNMNNVELIVDIDRIAKQDKIRIGEISLLRNSDQKKEVTTAIRIVEAKNYESVNLSFSFITNYDNFKSFVDKIRKSLRLLDIVSVNFSKNQQGRDGITNSFKFDLVVRSY